MDFLQSFRSVYQFDSNFHQSEEQLLQLKENDPVQFIHCLLEIMGNGSLEDKDRLNAMKFLTYPIRSNNTKKSDPFQNIRNNNVPDEVIDEVFEALLTYFSAPQEISQIASEIFIFYARNISLPQINALIIKLVQILQSSEEMPIAELKLYLKTMTKISVAFWRIEIDETRPYFISLLSSRNDLDDEIIQDILTMITKTITSDYNQEINEDVSMLLQLALSYTERFPKAALQMILRLNCRNFEEAFPDFPDTLFQIISSGPQYADFFQMVPHPCALEFPTYLGSRLEDYVNISLQVIGLNSTIEIDSEEDKTYPSGYPFYFLQNVIYSRGLNLYPLFHAYVEEHIQEEGTPEKYCAAIINNCLRTFRDDVGTLIYDIDQTTIVGLLVGDSNQIIYREGIKLIVSLIENAIFENCTASIIVDKTEKLDVEVEEPTPSDSQEQHDPLKFNITEEVLQLAFECYYSESESIQELARQLLSNIAQCKIDAFTEQIFSTFLEMIQDTENNSEESINGALEVLKSTTYALTPEQAAEMFPPVFQTVTSLFETDSSSILLGGYIQFLGQLYNKGFQFLTDCTQEILTLITRLWESDKEDDSLYLQNLLCMKYGKESIEILQQSKDFITHKLPDADNEENLSSIIRLCNSLLNTLPEPDPEFESFIVENSIPYIQAPEISKVPKSLIITTYSLINSHNPDLIGQKALILFDFMTEDLGYGFCYQSNADVTLTVLKNLPREQVGTSKQLKNLIQNSITTYANKLAFRFNNINKKTSATEEKQLAAYHIYELLEIADQYELTGEVKVWDTQYESVKEALPPECVDRFVELQPPPPPITDEE